MSYLAIHVSGALLSCSTKVVDWGTIIFHLYLVNGYRVGKINSMRQLQNLLILTLLMTCTARPTNVDLTTDLYCKAHGGLQVGDGLLSKV